MLYSMKIIKLRAMEEYFFNAISKIRNIQLKSLTGYYLVQIVFVAFLQVTPVTMPIVAFSVYAQDNGYLTPQTIFPALALFNILFQPLLVAPAALSQVVLAVVSWNRIREFLMAGELLPKENTFSDTDCIVFDHATFQWDKIKNAQEDVIKSGKNMPEEIPLAADDTPEYSFQDLSLSLPKGKLIAVIGAVGSGKSSLLSAIIGEMPKKDGQVLVNGSVAYCAQQPWILTETIRGNIFFNNAVDEIKLDNIIKVCSLKKDLQQFSKGAWTEIGEKGVNLSGGQKARVALARALYQDSDIYLLDDPLSALDAQVSKDVFQNAIKQYLSSKSVILVTHQLHILPDVDYILVVGSSGKILEKGTYKELMGLNGKMASMMKDYDVVENPDAIAKPVARRHSSFDMSKGDDSGKGGILVDEDRVIGAVEWVTYKSYIKAAGGAIYIIMLVFSAILSQLSQLSTNLWLSWWTENRYNLDTMTSLKIYAGLGSSQVFFSLFLNGSIILGAYKASRYFHKAALERLLNAPMSFYDSQPVGRILNRLSKDVESIDQQLWLFVFLTIISFTSLCGIVALLTYSSPPMIGLFIPLIVIYFFILKYYQRSSRELKRLDSIQRSPLYAHVSESLSGLSTIRAFKAEGSFVDRQRILMDVSNTPAYLKLSAVIWVNIRIELFATTVTFLLIMLAVSSAIPPAVIGLALTYAIAMTGNINLLLVSIY
jgi:ABC-type multidrug transport system fused ATPase/permease subunit